MYDMKNDKKSGMKSEMKCCGPAQGHMETKQNTAAGEHNVYHRYSGESAGKLSIYLKNKG